MKLSANQFNSSGKKCEKKVHKRLRRFLSIFPLLLGMIILIPGLIYPSFRTVKEKDNRLLHPAVGVNNPSHINVVHPVFRIKNSSRINVVHPVVTVNNPSFIKHTATRIADNNNLRIEQYLKKLHFNGSVLVVNDNKVLLNKGFGYADFQKKLPNTPETVFYIGSITKVFVATAIMQLQERGKLNVKDPLSKYIPGFPHGKQIKLFNLLTHTSGLPSHPEPRKKISTQDLIKEIEKAHLLFKPGGNWSYSDSNYSVLAYIVEKVSGEPINQYVKDNIFDIAGMKHSGFGDSFYKERFISNGYKKFGNKKVSTSLPDMSQLFGCGDIYSTTFDLYLFDKALYSGKLLSQNSLKQFFTPFRHNYAFGFDVAPDSYFDHGVVPGWNCLNSFSKNGIEFTILLSNVQNGVNSIKVVNNRINQMLKSKLLT